MFSFFFSFLPYSIPCVFTVLCPYTSGIFLFMCNYWSYIIGWVCLTMAKVLCPPSDLYMPVHSMCSNHCIAFNVSPPLWLSPRPAFRQPTLTCMKILLGMNDKKSWEKFVSASILFEFFFFFFLRNSWQVFLVKFPPVDITLVYKTSCFWSPYWLRFMQWKFLSITWFSLWFEVRL